MKIIKHSAAYANINMILKEKRNLINRQNNFLSALILIAFRLRFSVKIVIKIFTKTLKKKDTKLKKLSTLSSLKKRKESNI
jgi:hypothetical protein